MGKARRHTPEQIVNILRQIEVAVANGKTHPLSDVNLFSRSTTIKIPDCRLNCFLLLSVPLMLAGP